MKNSMCFLATLLAVASLLIAGCSQAAPAPAPTAAPAAPKAAEPTKVVAPTAPTSASAAAKPTAAAATPAKAAESASPKVNYPAGKAISMVVPWPAGGNIDITARILTPQLEKILGAPVQVLNKGGAGSQTGLTDVALAKPDGYTIGAVNLPTVSLLANDPERKAAFSRKSFEAVAAMSSSPTVVLVKSDSPYRTMKDLIDAAKAAPDKIKAASPGVLSTRHVAVLLLEKMTGVKFATVQFDGGASQMTALLGGHVDVSFQAEGEVQAQFKSGDVRILGVMDDQESKFFPGVKTLQAQGYNLSSGVIVFYAVPAGTPKDVVGVLNDAIKKGMDSDDLKTSADKSGITLRYMNTADLSAYWDKVDAETTQLIEMAKAK